MSQLFDAYERSYGEAVQSSIDFSGLPHDFFLAAKVDLLREVIATRLRGDSKPSALDIGCGIGAFHPHVKNLFGRLCGVDVSAPCVAQARQANPDVEYRAYPGGELPYQTAEFDLSLAVCVMHHVVPADWLAFVREMQRVTRRGGLVCVIEHNPLNPLTRLSVSRCPFDEDAVLLASGRTRRLMAEAGVRNIATRFFLLLPSARPLARRIERAFARLPLGAQYMTCGEA